MGYVANVLSVFRRCRETPEECRRIDLMPNWADILAAALTAGRAETSILISLKAPISIFNIFPSFPQEIEGHNEKCEQPGHALC